MGSLVKTVLTYVVTVLVLAVAFPLLWGLAGGAVGGLSVAQDPELQAQVREVLETHGLDAEEFPDSLAERIRWLGELAPEVREDLRGVMERGPLARANWFAVTFAVSAFAFALAGFACGFITRRWLYTGIVPALTFLFGNPVVAFDVAATLALAQKVAVVAVGQFGVCYLFAIVGAGLGRKREASERYRRDPR